MDYPDIATRPGTGRCFWDDVLNFESVYYWSRASLAPSRIARELTHLHVFVVCEVQLLHAAAVAPCCISSDWLMSQLAYSIGAAMCTAEH